ncbi:MAG: inositol monophosphatase family protein [Desulfovibrionaceae bacterium]
MSDTFDASAISPESLDFLLPRVEALVRAAGDLVAERIRAPKRIRRKGRIDLVTETDVEVEARLKRGLAEILPGSACLAEESAPGSLDSGSGQALWVIDPLDGTTNFAHGLPFVAISVALWQAGAPRLGVVHLPVLKECFTARAGGGAFLNGAPIAVSETEDPERALLATGFPYDIARYLPEILANLETMLPLVQGVRRAGSAALDLAYVACGRLDGFYESGLRPWDTAAGVLLVAEAGGRVTRYDPAEPYTPGDRDMWASNGRLHERLGRGLVRREAG